MKVLSYSTHTPHQYDIANALYDSQMDLIDLNWIFKQRPMPENVKFIDSSDVVFSEYDVAILHFGGETKPIMLDFFVGKLPIILVSHGLPVYTEGDVLDRNYSPQEISLSCGENLVVHCCEKEMKVWKGYGIKNGTWIWHGMKDEYLQCQYREKKPIIINAANWEYINNVDLLENLHKTGIPWLQKDFQVNSFDDYKKILSQYNVYISGTRHSSFPRTRAEAMHSGMCVITTNNWDEDKFIKDGENGFLVGNDFDQIMSIYNSFDLETIERVGKAGQATAKDVFGLEKYRQRWLEVIGEVIKK